MNKPQTEGRVNHVCTEEHREEVQHSSAIKQQRSTIISLSKVIFIINMIELIIKGQQQTHRLIK